MRRVSVVLLLTIGVATAQPPSEPWPPGVPDPDPCPAPDRDVVLRWNAEVLAAIRAERTPPPVAARNLAVVHVAVYDAVAAAAGDYRPFHVDVGPQPGADPVAAAAVAAHRTLVGLYPRRVEQFDDALDDTLGAVPDGPAKARGAALGQAVAERVLRWRERDGAARSGYAPRPGLGRWQPTPPDYRPPLLPGWTAVSCFALPDVAPFRPPAPPAVASEQFAASYHAVKLLGSATSAVRTRDQTEVALFWADGEGTVTPPGHWNRIARTVALDRRTTTAENARLFALLNVAMADAAIVCWDCKYRFDVWRPVTAIRAGAPGLPADPAWTPLLPTPPFPAYTSGHSSFSGAAAGALAAFFGTDRVRFASTSDGLPGATRRFDSFADAAREAGASRIYGGIHWDFDNAAGLACGREVGEYVARHFFRPRADRAGPTVGVER